MTSSTRSVTSLDGIQSLSSEEMALFIAGIKARKVGNHKTNQYEEEDGAETETNDAEDDEEGVVPMTNDSAKSPTFFLPSPATIANRNVEGSNNKSTISTAHNETSDSGLSLSENSQH